jgi:iron complex outermembrane receptor protein
MWTLEAGIKSIPADAGVLLTASVFHAWREDQQARASFQLVPNDPASFGFATINIDGGTSWGGEFEVHWQLSPSLDIYANAGLLFGGFPDTVEQFPWLEGRDQAHAPRYSVATGAIWRGKRGWFAGVDLSGRDEFYFDVSHNQQSERYTLLNARFGYESDDWRIQVWGRNLADKYYAVRGFFFGNEPPDFPATLYTRAGDPRHVGVTIERRFH